MRFAVLLLMLMLAGCVEPETANEESSSGDAAENSDGANGSEGTEQGEEEAQVPQMSFTKDSSDNTLTIVSTPQGEDQLDWVADLSFTGSCAENLRVNGSPDSGTWGMVNQGDVMSGCATDDTLQIFHTPTDTLLFMTTF